MRRCGENDMETKLDAFLRAVDEGDASPDVEDFDQEVFIKEVKSEWSNMPVDEYALEPNDTTIKAIHELNTRQTTQCSSYEDYISKTL